MMRKKSGQGCWGWDAGMTVVTIAVLQLRTLLLRLSCIMTMQFICTNFGPGLFKDPQLQRPIGSGLELGQIRATIIIVVQRTECGEEYWLLNVLEMIPQDMHTVLCNTLASDSEKDSQQDRMVIISFQGLSDDARVCNFESFYFPLSIKKIKTSLWILRILVFWDRKHLKATIHM